MKATAEMIRLALEAEADQLEHLGTALRARLKEGANCFFQPEKKNNLMSIAKSLEESHQNIVNLSDALHETAKEEHNKWLKGDSYGSYKGNA